MEQNNISISPSKEDAFNLKDIKKCPKCKLIPSFKLDFKKENTNIIYKCENKHEGRLLLKDYIADIGNCFSIQKCEECEKSPKDYFYCCNCNKFLCSNCQIKHMNESHNCTNPKKFVSLCKIHSNSYCFYCLDCKLNLCSSCKNLHESHYLIDLSKFNYTRESKGNLENEINEMEKTIKQLDNIKKAIISLIDNLKQSSELEIEFIKNLFKTYQYEDNLNNMNYYIINILKECKKNFKLNIIDNLKKINKEGEKYISLLKIARNNHSNSFNQYFRTIKDNFDSILYLSELKDGRLASSSSDNSLKIYKKDTFELQMSIIIHNKGIPSFTQINDGRIIICGDDCIINVIKLIGDEQFNVEQTFRNHSQSVRKIIEIKENILISISRDKSMKIWKINGENKIEFFKNYFFQNNISDCNILKVDEKKFVTISVLDKCLKFWKTNNYENYENISIINDIEADWTLKSMSMIEKDVLCLGGNNSKGFYLINTSTHSLIKNIPCSKRITSMHLCKNGLLLCSIIDNNDNNSLVIYNYNELNLEKIAEKEKAYNKIIYSCIELNDEYILC